jgi:D-sedoheptulose 7-phosphate isomerase
MTPHIHLDELIGRLPVLAACRTDVHRVFLVLRDAYRAQKKVLVCGNGGSAADAEHWAGELLKGFRSKRDLSAEDKAKLAPELAASLQGALPIIPLTGFSSLNTAFGNDVSPAFAFAQLVWGLGLPGDVFIGISTSGNARNVCAAAQTARARGLTTVGLTGDSGGALKALCDYTIRVPSQQTHLVQEYHLPVYHCLSLMLEDEFFPES